MNVYISHLLLVVTTPKSPMFLCLSTYYFNIVVRQESYQWFLFCFCYWILNIARLFFRRLANKIIYILVLKMEWNIA